MGRRGSHRLPPISHVCVCPLTQGAGWPVSAAPAFVAAPSYDGVSAAAASCPMQRPPIPGAGHSAPPRVVSHTCRKMHRSNVNFDPGRPPFTEQHSGNSITIRCFLKQPMALPDGSWASGIVLRAVLTVFHYSSQRTLGSRCYYDLFKHKRERATQSTERKKIKLRHSFSQYIIP